MEEQQIQYIAAIVKAVNSLFEEESPNKQYDLDKIDFTQFLTAYIKAGNYLLNELTEVEKNNLEFTHLANQLIVQDMMNTPDDEPDFG